MLNGDFWSPPSAAKDDFKGIFIDIIAEDPDDRNPYTQDCRSERNVEGSGGIGGQCSGAGTAEHEIRCRRPNDFPAEAGQV